MNLNRSLFSSCRRFTSQSFLKKQAKTTTSTVIKKSWQSPETQQFCSQFSNEYKDFAFSDFETELDSLLTKHEQFNDKECVNLNAATNICNPKCEKFLRSTIGTRPSLGDIGNKYNRGMKYTDKMEFICNQLLCQLFNAKYCEFRVPSGCISNLYAFMACCQPYDRILTFSQTHSGHATHLKIGAAGLYGLHTEHLPLVTFDNTNNNNDEIGSSLDGQEWDYPVGIDLNAFRNQLYEHHPSLVVIGASMTFYPINIVAMRSIIDEYNNSNKNKHCYFMYDAAHMGGIIAGNSFQADPLSDGIDLMTGSTYKSFGGPNCGFIVTNNEELAQKLSEIAHPGLTANYDCSKLGALSVSIMDLLEFGDEYSKQCIKNAQVLSEELYKYNLPIWTYFEEFDSNTINNILEQHSAATLKYNPFNEAQFVAMNAEWDWIEKGVIWDDDIDGKLNEGSDITMSYLKDKWEESKDVNNNINRGRLLSMYLEKFNLLSTEILLYNGKQGIRMGTPELTRLGMKEQEMKQIGAFFNDIFNNPNNKTYSDILNEVRNFRKGYQDLHFIRT